MSLEEKLDKILDPDGIWMFTNDNEKKKAITAIKEAFADEGWMSNSASTHAVARSLGYMTGQEWYAAFIDELGSYGAIPYNDTKEKVIEAAKKASGLSNED